MRFRSIFFVASALMVAPQSFAADGIGEFDSKWLHYSTREISEPRASDFKAMFGADSDKGIEFVGRFKKARDSASVQNALSGLKRTAAYCNQFVSKKSPSHFSTKLNLELSLSKLDSVSDDLSAAVHVDFPQVAEIQVSRSGRISVGRVLSSPGWGGFLDIVGVSSSQVISEERPAGVSKLITLTDGELESLLVDGIERIDHEARAICDGAAAKRATQRSSTVMTNGEGVQNTTPMQIEKSFCHSEVEDQYNPDCVSPQAVSQRRTVK